KGAVVFWKEDACDALPFEAGKKACHDERAALKKTGERQAAQMRKDDPDWWKTPYLNTYVYGDTRLRTEELRPTASIWGGGSFDGWRDDEVYMTHAVGVRKIPSHSFGYIGENDLDFMRTRLMEDEGITLTGPEDLKKPEVVRIKTDLDYLQTHSPIFKALLPALSKDFDRKQVVTGAMGRISSVDMDPGAPGFRDYLISYGKWQVDAGAEGLFFDDLGGHDPNLSFGDDALAHFGPWLAANAPQAAAKYGVADAASLDYLDFLRKRGLSKKTIDDAAGPRIGASDRWRSIPLMVEFRRYLAERQQAALAAIVGAVRDYAASKGRADFFFGGNSGELAPSAAYTVPLLDSVTFEHGYAQSEDPMKWKSVVPLTKLANAKERPVTNQLVVTQWQAYAKLAAPLRSDLLRLMAMESVAAHGANHYVRYSAFDPRRASVKEEDVYLALEDRSDLSEMAKAFGFLRVHRDAYRDIAESGARVAILYDNGETAREWREGLTSNHQYAVEDAARALYAKNVEFDIVNGKQLASGEYSLVFVPTMKTISPDASAALQRVRQSGGKVLALGTLPAGTATDGSVSAAQAATAAAAANVPVMKLPENVRSLSYRNAKGDLLVNLMNYDYSSAGFKERKDIAIDPALVAGAKKITYASLERPESVELDAAKPVIPSLTTYGLLVIER
ncbi:MAG TPA: hypothetical protein VJ694_01540, partial [Patescibacteria group bacterium]|nr:hypothetical protein [Patescibacteria group bacterium]